MKRLLAVGVALVAMALQAGEWKISSPTEVGNEAAVAALTNALTQAQTDDVITLAAGTYDLSGVCMDPAGSNFLYMATKVTLQGADETSWRETADFDTKTILDGGNVTNRILLIASSVQKPVIRNLTFVHGRTYVQSDAKTAYGGGLSHNGAAAANRADVYNCVFRDNSVWQRGGATYNVVLHDCRIFRCQSLNGSTGPSGEGCDYYDSLIEGITNAYSCIRGTIASNCTFRALKSTQWSAAAFELTKLYDCDIENCMGSWQILSLSANTIVSGCTFHDIPTPAANDYPILRGSAGLVTNCVFTRVGGKGWGCCIRGTSNAVRVFDCVFTNNTLSTWANICGGCICGSYADGVPTTDPTKMPIVVNCTFRDNAITANGCLGAACAAVVASNCTFVGCSTMNGGGAVAYGTYVNCVFKGNKTTQSDHGEWHSGGGTGLFGSYYDCVFEDSVDVCNSGAKRGSGTLVKADVVSNCVFRNCHSAAHGGAVCKCGLVIDSVISNCYANSFGAAYQSPLVNCTITGEGLTALYQCEATNCLIYGLTSRDASAHTIFWRSTNVVNCTIADVTDSNYQFVSDNNADEVTTFKNCIIYNVGGIRGSATNPVRFDHCFYDDMRLANTTLVDCQVSASSPFVPMTHEAYDPATPYAIRSWSKTRGLGVEVGFTASDVDRAGNPRLRDGALDLGCYQCLLPMSGVLLMVY